MAYDPDFWLKQGTVYPALSSSIQYTQGAEVKNDWFAQRTLPLLGRGSNERIVRSLSASPGAARFTLVGSNADFTRNIEITSADNSTSVFTAGNAEDTAAGIFKSDGTAAQAATSLADCIAASNIGAKISVENDLAGTLTLTQLKAGKVGNTSVIGSYVTWIESASGYITSFFSGSDYWSHNITEQRYFDDSMFGKINIPGGSNEANINFDGKGVIETRFTYYMIGDTFGLTDVDPLPSEPYRDKNYFNAVQYLTNSGSMTWPVVLEDPAAIDILDYNGVIEPLTIRTAIGMSSTFVNDHLDPEPHSFRGALGGSYVWEPYSRFNPITNYYQIDDSNKNYPWAYVVDWRIYQGFSRYIPDSTYTDNDDIRLMPYVEKTIKERIFADVSDLQMQNYYIYNSGVSGSLEGLPTVNSKTKPCGYEYENCIIGTDSLAFGGLLK